MAKNGDSLPALSGAEALVAGGAAIVKAENENMQMVAVQRPRDEAKIHREAIDELKRVPRLAERIYYTLPYKDHIKGCKDRKNCNCPDKPIRGVSVKGALALARRWGNCAATVRIVEDSVEQVTLEGVFLDLETNARFSTPKVVSKFQTWGGKRERMYDANLEKLVASTASKVKRNSILDGLPDWLIEDYYQTAREIALELEKLSAEPFVDKILRGFAPYDISRERIEKRFGRSLDDLTDEMIGDLRGVLNALKQKETTVDEAFPADDEPQPETGTVDDVVKGGAKTTAGAEASPQKKEKS